MTAAMELSAAQLSCAARTAALAMVKTGEPAVVQFERGERKAYFRTVAGREKPVDASAVDELVKAGVVTDRQDGLFSGTGQTFAPAKHAVMRIKLSATRTDRATGARYRKADVETTAGVFGCEVCIRASKDADQLDGAATKVLIYQLIAEKRPVLGGAQ